MSLRTAAPLVLTAAVLAPAAGARGSAAPLVVHRGQVVKIAVRTPSLSVCLAEAHYSQGASQSTTVKQATEGVVSWRLRVPVGAPLGPARWSVRCGVTWERSGAWLVRPALPRLPA